MATGELSRFSDAAVTEVATLYGNYNALGVRQAIAQEMVKHALDPSATDEVEQTTPIRKVLLAQWGNNRLQTIEAAQRLIDLQHGIESSLGQSAMVFKKGSQDAEGQFSWPLDIHAGTLASKCLYIFIAGNLESEGPSRDGVPPPYIGFGAALKLRARQRIMMHADGRFRIGAWQAAEQFVFAYTGTIPLVGDEATYQDQRKVFSFSAMFDNEKCLNVLRDMVDLGNMDTLESYMNGRRQGLLAADKPLTDLTLTFSKSTQPVNEKAPATS